MAFSVGSLANYTKENVQPLLTSAVLGSKTAQLLKDAGQIVVGIKSSEKLPIMDTDAFFQSGDSCGFNASGTTSFTQRTLTIGRLKLNETLCLRDLESKFLQQALPAGSNYDSMVFAEAYANRKAEKIAAQLETASWQGDTASANGNLNKFDGFLKHITAAGGSVVNANSVQFNGSVATDITDANVIGVFDAVYKAIPAEIVAKDDVAIFCGMDVFRTYILKLKNSNLFNYQIDVKADSEFFLPGTPIKVIALQGLNGTNKIVAGRISNLFIGTDLMDEQFEKFKMWYDDNDDLVKTAVHWKYGTQIAFPDQIVKFFV
jgi:hypothetical protein